jgi:hypothetical protein
MRASEAAIGGERFSINSRFRPERQAGCLPDLAVLVGPDNDWNGWEADTSGAAGLIWRTIPRSPVAITGVQDCEIPYSAAAVSWTIRRFSVNEKPSMISP